MIYRRMQEKENDKLLMEALRVEGKQRIMQRPEGDYIKDLYLESIRENIVEKKIEGKDKEAFDKVINERYELMKKSGVKALKNVRTEELR